MSTFAISFTFSFVDSKNKTASTKINVPTGLTIAGIISFGQAAAQILANFSSCRLTGLRACIGIDISGLGLLTAPATGSDRSEKGLFNMRTAGNTYGKIMLPTFAESLVVANTDQIDETDTDVAAFITALEDGLTMTSTAVIAPVDLRDNDFIEVTETRELFRAFKPSS